MTSTTAVNDLVTGEAVALELPHARVASRALSFLIDQVAAVMVIYTIAVAFVAHHDAFDGAAVAAILISVTVVSFIGYPIVVGTLWSGRTLGRAALGIRVVRDDGGPASFRAIATREVVGFFVDGPMFLYLPGLITMLASRRGQRIGDHLAGTVMVHERLPLNAGMVPVMPPPLVGWAASLRLDGLSDALALSARRFLARVHELRPDVRERLGAQIAGDLAAAVGAPPPGTPGWAFLCAVLAERRRREELRLAGMAAGSYRPQPMDGPFGVPARPTPRMPHPATHPTPAPPPAPPAAPDQASGWPVRPPQPQPAQPSAPPSGGDFAPPA